MSANLPHLKLYIKINHQKKIYDFLQKKIYIIVGQFFMPEPNKIKCLCVLNIHKHYGYIYYLQQMYIYPKTIVKGYMSGCSQ